MTMPSDDELRNKISDLTDTKDWMYDCTAYSEGQNCCCETTHPNCERLMQLIYADRRALLEKLRRTIEALYEIEADDDGIDYQAQERNKVIDEVLAALPDAGGGTDD